MVLIAPVPGHSLYFTFNIVPYIWIAFISSHFFLFNGDTDELLLSVSFRPGSTLILRKEKHVSFLAKLTSGNRTIEKI